MRIPTMTGIIDRRVLANFHVDPDVIARILPSPFRPKLKGDHAIAGICLIRLKRLRPHFLPIPLGFRSENAAHRIAVEWDVDGEIREGVFIPRRDTDSRLNAWAGGTLFPGIHHHASFTVEETADSVSIAMRSDDCSTHVSVAGQVAADLPAGSVFESVADASAFFESGSLGYSPAAREGQYDGLQLCCHNWQVTPLDVSKVESSFFDDRSRFPAGTAEFDCALLMRGIRHEWLAREELCCGLPRPLAHAG